MKIFAEVQAKQITEDGTKRKIIFPVAVLSRYLLTRGQIFCTWITPSIRIYVHLYSSILFKSNLFVNCQIQYIFENVINMYVYLVLID